MDWRLNLLIAIGVITLVASVLGSIEQILRFLKMVVRPVIKRFYIKRGTWPLKVAFKSAKLTNGSTYPTLAAMVLLEPRKAITLGKCTMVYLLDNLELTPRATGEDYNFQEWEIGNVLDKPRTYRLKFYAPGAKRGHNVQIQIESEGYECKSNLISIT